WPTRHLSKAALKKPTCWSVKPTSEPGSSVVPSTPQAFTRRKPLRLTFCTRCSVMPNLLHKPRIALLPEQVGLKPLNACCALRILYPFTQPSVRTRFEVEVIEIHTPIDTYHVVVVQRFLHPNVSIDDAEAFVATLKRAGVRLIVDLDDNLLDPHPY